MDEKDFIYGKNNVLEMLRSGSRKVNKITLLKTGRFDKKIDEIVKAAKEKSIPFSFTGKEAFLKFSEVSHQGVVAMISPVEYVELEDFLKKEKDGFKRVVVLDGVEDPHNVGSIIRTAVCAGFDAVIIPKHRNALVNATVEKSSAGAVNKIDIIGVGSLQSTYTALKDNDFWIIASDIRAADNYYDIDYTGMNFAIVMGSENKGISRTSVINSDFRALIPIEGEFDSLNVANAASIIIYEAVRQNLKGVKAVETN